MTESSNTEKAARVRSEFSVRLAGDPELAARCDVIAKSLQGSANEEVRDLERSEQLTKDDLGIYINARSDSLLAESDD